MEKDGLKRYYSAKKKLIPIINNKKMNQYINTSILSRKNGSTKTNISNVNIYKSLRPSVDDKFLSNTRIVQSEQNFDFFDKNKKKKQTNFENEIKNLNRIKNIDLLNKKNGINENSVNKNNILNEKNIVINNSKINITNINQITNVDRVSVDKIINAIFEKKKNDNCRKKKVPILKKYFKEYNQKKKLLKKGKLIFNGKKLKANILKVSKNLNSFSSLSNKLNVCKSYIKNKSKNNYLSSRNSFTKNIHHKKFDNIYNKEKYNKKIERNIYDKKKTKNKNKEKKFYSITSVINRKQKDKNKILLERRKKMMNYKRSKSKRLKSIKINPRMTLASENLKKGIRSKIDKKEIKKKYKKFIEEKKNNQMKFKNLEREKSVRSKLKMQKMKDYATNLRKKFKKKKKNNI